MIIYCIRSGTLFLKINLMVSIGSQKTAQKACDKCGHARNVKRGGKRKWQSDTEETGNHCNRHMSSVSSKKVSYLLNC